ncbi:hypothetical protein PFISCL1PPCAC_18453, partial [Pristionchus fissidentatus]
KDLFSNLPDDHLLKIFFYLNFQLLDAIKCVNQRMRYFAEYQISKTEKINASQLIIAQDSRGHLFYLLQDSDDILNYLYRIRNPEICSESGEKNAIEIREAFRGIETHNVPVPSLLFARLEKLIERYSFDSLVLMNLKIDSIFLRNLERTVASACNIALLGVVIE